MAFISLNKIPNINFMTFRKVGYALSGLFIFLSFLSYFTKGLNYGIDFRGGYLIEIKTQEKADIAQMRSDLSRLNIGAVNLQEFGSDRDVLIRIESQDDGLSENESQEKVLEKIKLTLGEGITYRRVETVGAKVSQDLVWNGILAALLATVGIAIYIWFRFEWKFGICAVIGLVHDCIVVIGLYSLIAIEFNETEIIAILTTLGYSINDTVVIYDRVRENLRKFKKRSLGHIINLSLNETLSRTILTAGTTLLALFALYFFGGYVIEVFCLPIIFGIIIGTYSSICVVPFLLLLFPEKKTETAGL